MYVSDKRFAVQARMTGALQVSLNVAKQNPQNFKVLHPVLQVLKIYANSRMYTSFFKLATIKSAVKALKFNGMLMCRSLRSAVEVIASLSQNERDQETPKIFSIFM